MYAKIALVLAVLAAIAVGSWAYHEHQAAQAWKTYANAEQGFALEYPPGFAVVHEGYDALGAYELTLAPVASTSPGSLTLLKEDAAGDCYHDLCDATVESQVTYGGIVWDDLGADCAGGICDDDAPTYRTVEDDSRYYVSSDEPGYAEAVLKTLKFIPSK